MPSNRLAALISCVFIVLSSVTGARAENRVVVTLSMGVLRASAASIVLPEYPQASFGAKHEGPAVVKVLVSPAGEVIETSVLEAPDTAIANAVLDAVKQWSFHAFVMRRQSIRGVSGRLLFYFRIRDGRPLVIDALAPAGKGTPN
jgi:TonB family protein